MKFRVRSCRLFTSGDPQLAKTVRRVSQLFSFWTLPKPCGNNYIGPLEFTIEMNVNNESP